MNPPAWMQRARCAIEYGPTFDRDLTPAEQVAVCSGCEVRDACLAYGLETDANVMSSGGWQVPIYGAKTPKERKKIAKAAAA